MSVQDNLRATHIEKTQNAMKAPCTVSCITFTPSKANPGETLCVFVPKLNENEVLVPGSLALLFDIDLSGGHANNFLVQNVTRALVSRMKVKFGGTILEDAVDYDVYKIFQDLFLPGEKRDNMVPEGIQSKDLCKIRSGAGDSEKYIFPDLKKISVTINGSPDMRYSNGIKSLNIWSEVSRIFMKDKYKPQHMTLKKFYTDDKFGLLINLRSMASQKMHGSGTRLVNSTDGIQLRIERHAKGTGQVNCHVFVISDAQLNIVGKQLDSVQY